MGGDQNSKSWNKNLIDSLAIEDFAAKMKLISCSEGESAITKHTGVIWNANLISGNTPITLKCVT